MTDSRLVDVDAGTVFAHPRRIVLALTFVAGVLDAVGFSQFGVFTANQAGNLVIGWTQLPDDAAAALLSLSSILGCGVGVVSLVLLRSRWPWLAGRSGSRTLLIGSAALIMVATVIGFVLSGPRPATAGTAPQLATAQWWGEAASVALAAASVAMLAMVFISGGGMRAPILASTNAYVDAVRYATASGLSRGDSTWSALARRAAGFPLAWTLGAATTVLLPVGGLAMVAFAAAVIVGVAVLARRVKDPADGQRRTV